ncbi:MAG: polyphenol oxidase family protein [Armatimonadota bacterium]|nr:polyphenol oxidase family protein [Armatimonadota bacterium]
MGLWEHKVGWPGADGGFIGRTVGPAAGSEAPDPVQEAMADLGAEALVEAQQVHGGEVVRVRARDLAGKGTLLVPDADGLLTDVPGVALAIYVADCLAIFLHHPGAPAVGLAHAGWRGLAAGIPGTLVERALAEHGGRAGDLRLALSPCIRRCCFEVGEEVAELFEGVPGAVDRSRTMAHVDMVAVARAQITAAGVPEAAVEVMPGCTHCEPERFASYRWDSERCGRNVALIALAR